MRHVVQTKGTCWGTDGRCPPDVSGDHPRPFGRRTEALNAHHNRVSKNNTENLCAYVCQVSAIKSHEM